MKNMKKVLLVFVVVLFAVVLISCKKTIMHTVVFANTELNNVQVADGKKLAKPSAPTLEGQEFDDWYKDADFAALFDFEIAIKEDTTVYAKFTPKEEEESKYLSIADAIAMANDLEHDTPTKEKYLMRGKITSISNVEFGNMMITDGTDEFLIYGVWSVDGKLKYGELDEKPVTGDTIEVYGPISKFFESPQMKDSWLQKLEKGEKPEFNEADYTKMSIADAHAKAENAKPIIEGVVTTITYANGMLPNGFFLVDDTGAMYIFDYDIVLSVKPGDTVQLAGTRKNFILPGEEGLAAQLGYEGAIQLADVFLMEHTKGSDDFDKSWITETSIKDLMDTNPKDKNITGTIFKANAFINEVPGLGFTNFYLNDIDGKTGSYSYSMNNGNDFSWLREFDGQLREVYFSVLNAKSTPGGLIYRLVPIKVGPIVTYDQSYNAEYAVKYHGLDQFESTYAFSPSSEYLTTVSSELLNITGVSLSYSSSNEASVKFIEVDDKIKMEVGVAGKATITVTAVDGDNTFFDVVEITIVDPSEVDSIAVSDAIALPDDTDVLVEGIVGPSLVNKSGFYLIDDSGAIAVEMVAEELSKLKQGNKVIISGIKTHTGQKYDDETGLILEAIGQIAIRQATIAINMFGVHDYSTDSFKTGKTLGDFEGLPRTVDHSTDVYVFDVIIEFEEEMFYSKYNLADASGAYMNIYSASGGQLRFLNQFVGQTVTVEFTVVNWNGKNYSGSVLSVTKDGVKYINNSNFN